MLMVRLLGAIPLPVGNAEPKMGGSGTSGLSPFSITLCNWNAPYGQPDHNIPVFWGDFPYFIIFTMSALSGLNTTCIINLCLQARKLCWSFILSSAFLTLVMLDWAEYQSKQWGGITISLEHWVTGFVALVSAFHLSYAWRMCEFVIKLIWKRKNWKKLMGNC